MIVIYVEGSFMYNVSRVWGTPNTVIYYTICNPPFANNVIYDTIEIPISANTVIYDVFGRPQTAYTVNYDTLK